MKGGAENRKKTVIAGSLGAVAFCCLLYAYNTLFGGPSTPPPAVASTSAAPPPVRSAGNRTGANSAGTSQENGQKSSAGVPAARLASASSTLDPTLDDRAMLRTESLMYSGLGRNIFSATYTPPAAPVKLPTHVPSPRPQAVVLPPAPTGPPPPPPINLKFFGTASRPGSNTKEAFLLSGEDVYVARAGEIVARRYKIVQIATSSIIVQDLGNGNTQTLPLLMR